MEGPGGTPEKIFTPPPEQKEGMAKYIALAASGCLVVLLFFGAIFYFVFRVTSGPVDIVNHQLDALRSGDIDRAYSYCSGAFKQSTNLNAFRYFVESHPLLKHAKDFSSPSREISGSTATLKGTINGLDGSKLPVEYQMINENGAWKIHYIDLKASGIASEDQAAKVINPNSTMSSTSTGALKITDVNADKEAGNNSTTVRLNFQVLGFKNDHANGASKIHLTQDLETYDPNGKMLQELSQLGIKELQESSSPQDYTYANFINTLTIPSSFPTGKYRARITVHDQLSGNTAEITTEFFVP
jgi:Domain of unknown function (DUF4864)